MSLRTTACMSRWTRDAGATLPRCYRPSNEQPVAGARRVALMFELLPRERVARVMRVLAALWCSVEFEPLTAKFAAFDFARQGEHDLPNEVEHRRKDHPLNDALPPNWSVVSEVGGYHAERYG